MLKITLVLVSLLAVMFYFLRDTVSGSHAVAPASLQKLAALPREVKESSGIVVLPQQGQYLTHNDAGNKPHLYRIDEQGRLLETLPFEVPNTDWEDITQDDSGNLYIADTGNNDNDRRDLTVYKVSSRDMTQAQPIRFVYEDQTAFPPPKKDRNFDSEAIFWHDSHLYLISKDRGRGETANVYRLPDAPGQHTAKLLGSHKLKTKITGAAISPDEETVALLSEEKLHLFRDYDEPASFYEGVYEAVALDGTGQTEAVDFEDDNTLIITSEGGNLYRYTLGE